jgi:hypothetical protein
MLNAPQECTMSTRVMTSIQIYSPNGNFSAKYFSPLFSKVIIVEVGVQRVQKSVHRHSIRHWCHRFP